MIRRAFLRRMAFAAAACAFFDVGRLVPRLTVVDDRPFVCWIGDRGFHTLSDAFDAVAPGGTIVVTSGGQSVQGRSI